MEPQPPAQTPPTTPTPEASPPGGWMPAGQPPAIAPPARPTVILVAGILLMIIGVLVGLLGLLFILAGAFIGNVGDTGFSGQFANLPAAVGAFVVVLGFIFLIFGAAEVLTGIYVLPGRPWARITAIVLSVLGGLFSLGGVLDSGSGRGAIILPIIFLVAYVFVIWAVVANGRWFAHR